MRTTISLPVATVVFVALSLGPRATIADERPAAAPSSWRLSSHLPFTAPDLRRAVAARILAPAHTLQCNTVAVRPEGAESVLVLCGDRGRIVSLGDRQAADAARAVAVVLIDLAQTALSVPSAPVPAASNNETTTATTAATTTATTAATTTATTAATTTVAETHAAKTPGAERATISVRGAVGMLLSRGFQSADVLMPGVIVGAEIGVGSLWFGAHGRYQWTRPQTTAIEPDVTSRAMRASAGIAIGPWRTALTATAARISTGRTADYNRTLFAAGLHVARRFTVRDGVWLVVSVDAETFARRLSVEFEDRVISTTPRVNVETSLALQWRFGNR